MNISEKTTKLFDASKEYQNPELFHGILLPQNCYNPVIAKKALSPQRTDNPELKQSKELDISNLNKKYFLSLGYIRQGVSQKNILFLIKSIETFFKEIFVTHNLKFKDFLRFKGVFSDCTWFYNETENIDLICTQENLLQDFGLSAFYNGATPKAILKKAFEHYLSIETFLNPDLNYHNPFTDIIDGKIYMDHTFPNAVDLVYYLQKEKRKRQQPVKKPPKKQESLWSKPMTTKEIATIFRSTERGIIEFIMVEKKKFNPAIRNDGAALYSFKNIMKDQIKKMLR